MKTETEQIRSNLIWNTVGSVTYLASQWLITLLVVRLSFNIENAGLLNLAISVSAIFGTMATFNLRTYIVSDTSCKITDDSYVLFRLSTCILSFIVCSIYSLLFRYSLIQYAAILLYMIFRICEAAIDLFNSFEQKAMRMDYGGKSMIFRGVVGLIAFSVCFYISQNVIIGIASLIAVSVISICLYDYPKSKNYLSIGLSYSKQEIMVLLKDGSLISLMTFLGDWIATYSRQVVASLFGTAAVGLYSSVAAPAIVVQVGIGYIFNPLLPSLHRLYQEGDLKQYLKMVFKVIIILAVFSFISFVASVFLGSPVLSLLFGNQVGAWSYLLPSLIVFTALNAFQWFIRVLLVMERTLIPEVFIHLFEAILFFVLSSKFANFFGVIGVNYAMIISVLFSSISLLFLFLFNCKKVGFKRSDF